MKLIFAVVNGDDSQAVSKALTKNGFFATKLASTGGFLSAGKTTFMICTDNEKVDRVIEKISQKVIKENGLYRLRRHTESEHIQRFRLKYLWAVLQSL